MKAEWRYLVAVPISGQKCGAPFVCYGFMRKTEVIN
jgi:hypothetical protein